MVTDDANRPSTLRKRSGSINGTGVEMLGARCQRLRGQKSTLEHSKGGKDVPRVHDLLCRYKIAGDANEQIGQVAAA